MVGRKAEHLEIVEVPFDLGPVGDVKTEPGEDPDDVVHRLAHRVPVAATAGAPRQRDIELLAVQLLVHLPPADVLARLLQQGLELRDGVGDQLPQARPLGGGNGAERLAQPGERAALAEVLDPRRFDLLLVARARQFLPRFGKQCVDPIDHLDTPSGTTKAAPVPRRGLVANCSKAYAAARLTIAANACGSTTAMSASTLRSSAIFAFFKPAMKRE